MDAEALTLCDVIVTFVRSPMKKDLPHPAKILLVDDNILGSTARGMILKEHGYEVETALSGEEAWGIFQKDHFDIVVTDFRMKGMTGLELIISSHKIHPQLKTVLTSGSVDAEVAAKHSREVHKFLGKPYLPAQLTAMVGELLQRRS